MRTGIALFCFALAAGSLAQNSAPTPHGDEGPVTLLCKGAASDHLLTQNLVIDYKHGTVNGKRAKITDTSITWQTVEMNSSRTAKTTYDHEINRLSGTYSTNSHTPGAIYGGPPPTHPTYHCDKAPVTKKF
jgi:hypothetical protein